MRAVDDLPVLHTRRYDVSSYKESDTLLRIRGTVEDVKPEGLYIPEDTEPMTIHHMVVDIVVEFPSLEIVDAEVEMLTRPHHECSNVVDHYRNLIGLSIARGFTHRVRELFGGPRGCTHTTALLQAMAPVAIQSMWSMMAPAPGETPVAFTPAQQRERVAFNLNTCHVWAEHGPMFSLLDRDELIPPPIWAEERLEQLGLDISHWRRGTGD
jgi:hypothetical protein